MRRFVLSAIAAALVTIPAFAVEPGQAEGTLTVGSEKIPLVFVYAIGRQKNEFSGRKDDIRIILTSKPLPESADLETIEDAFPDGVYGFVASIDNKRAVSHVVAQFSTGMYDAGFFGPGDNYAFTGKVGDGRVEGHLTSKTITTSTTQFSFDVTVNAAVK